MKYSIRVEKSQLSELKNTNQFKNTYYKLIQNDSNLTIEEQKFILLSAILFLIFIIMIIDLKASLN